MNYFHAEIQEILPFQNFNQQELHRRGFICPWQVTRCSTNTDIELEGLARKEVYMDGQTDITINIWWTIKCTASYHGLTINHLKA